MERIIHVNRNYSTCAEQLKSVGDDLGTDGQRHRDAVETTAAYALRNNPTISSRSQQTFMSHHQLGQPHPVSYTAYLVRLWQDNLQAPWRASAQHARTGEIIRFADLEQLFHFLESQTGDESTSANASTQACNKGGQSLLTE